PADRRRRGPPALRRGVGRRGVAGLGVPDRAVDPDRGHRGPGRGLRGALRDEPGAADILGRSIGTIDSRPARRTMIAISEAAAGKVKELLEEEGRNDIALRVAVQPGGCSGLRYSMYLDDQVSDGDEQEEQFGVRVVVDRMSVPYLSAATIDFVDSL